MPNWFDENAPKGDTVTMLDSEDGQVYHVPSQNMKAAQGRGLKPVVKMTSPDGDDYWIPKKNAERATKQNWFEKNAPNQVAVISPEGDPGHIPQENLQAAQGRGFKPAVMVTSPEGESGWMPRENVEKAVKERGFTVGQAPTSVEQAFPQYNREKESNTRQSAVAGMTGMPTPNMTEEDKASFEKGKAAGAISNVATAAAVTASAPGVIGAVGTAAKWAKDNPVVTTLGYHLARELGIPLPKVLDVLGRFKE